MDNKKRTLIVDTFDDLISMNGDVYDTQKLTVKYASCKTVWPGIYGAVLCSR